MEFILCRCSHFSDYWEQLPTHQLLDLIRMTAFYIELKIAANARANVGDKLGHHR